MTKIEPTDEMVQLAVRTFLDAPGTNIGEIDAAMRAALAGALAIVERDRAAEVEREWDALQPCPSVDPDHPVWQCEREAGHEGEHRAMRWQLTWTSDQPTEIPCCRGAGVTATKHTGGDS